MKILKILMVIVSALVLVFCFLFYYYGGFKTINFFISENGGEMVAYQEYIGDYKETGNVMSSVSKLLEKAQITSTSGFGTYFDDPKKVDPAKLRSEIGFIIDKKDSTSVSNKIPMLKIKTLPFGKYIATTFPFKGIPSIFIGIMKVYPALGKYIKDNKLNENGPITEIYNEQNHTITYRKQIEE
ncbi:MAG: GyrI-like domain-containing protein [Saprospiraceae bacterium]|nr:GyrI-like domain-containing protein [Saprospiraceae bacterium]